MTYASALSLKQLRALVAINENGTLAAAAQVLNLTAPAVSTQLRLLEQNFGVKLVLRGHDGKTSLTTPGIEVLRTAYQIDAHLTSCYERVKSISTGKSGYLSIGVTSTGKYFAPQLVSTFQKANPDIEIGLKIGNREEIISLISEGTVDLAITGRPPRASEVIADILGPHPHIFIAPQDHSLSTGCDVLPEELLNQTFLTRERGSGTRILMERLLDRIGEGRPYHTVQMGTNETIKQAVIAGLGIAFISGHTVASELADGRLVQIKAVGVPIIRQWFLIHRRNIELSAVAEKFHDFIISERGRFLPKMPG
jgi:LysR family transcriptional regulator, low CO2-responsive transcriptional regulator